MRPLWLMAVMVAMLDRTSAHHSPEDSSAEVTSTHVTSSDVTSAHVTSSDATSSDVTSPVGEEQRQVVPSESSKDTSDAKLLFPLMFTTTLTSFNVQSVTSTIPFTCFNSLTGTTTPCTGRRRRRRSGHLARTRALEAPALTSGDPDLLGSLSEDRVDPTQSESSRLVLTTWVTSVTSVTSVSTIIKYDTTVSLGLLCTVGGSSFYKFCP